MTPFQPTNKLLASPQTVGLQGENKPNRQAKPLSEWINDELNREICRLTGWTEKQIEGFETKIAGGSIRLGRPIPNYSTDLNAMHEAEKLLTNQQIIEYHRNIYRVTKDNEHSLFATARQRTEAFVATFSGLPVSDVNHQPKA